MSINLAGPAYRVTIPSCVLVATLRLKQKAEREAKQKAEREANKTNKTWYLAIVFLIGLAVLAVFSSKKNTTQAITQIVDKKAVLKKLKNPSHKNHKKNNNNHPKAQNHPKHKNNKEAEAKER